MKQRLFSVELAAWARSNKPKTVGGLISSFGKDSFAIIILVLMLVPALPIPTGGVTHVFEIITMLLAVELVAGRRAIWLPQRWQRLSLERFARGRMLHKFIRTVQWFERFTKPRFAGLMADKYFLPILGLIVLLLTLAAFLAPPFSGLDTLPSLGVVVIALAIIFDDFLFFVAGTLLGAVGVGLTIALGSAIYSLF